MSLSVDYSGVSVSFDESDIIETVNVIDCYDSEVEVLGYDEYGVEYTAIGSVSCDELVRVFESSVWPVEGEGFSVPDETELLMNDVDDGSWVGR